MKYNFGFRNGAHGQALFPALWCGGIGVTVPFSRRGFIPGQALLARARYSAFAHLTRGVRLSAQQVARTPLYLVVDWIAWALPLAQYAFRPLRRRW